MTARGPSTIRRALKWTAVTLAALVVLYLVWLAVYLTGFFYASSRYERTSCDDPRSVIEDNTGLLRAQSADVSSLGGYASIPTLQEALSVTGREIVRYGLFGAYFTVVYDREGNCLARIDNGLDG